MEYKFRVWDEEEGKIFNVRSIIWHNGCIAKIEVYTGDERYLKNLSLFEYKLMQYTDKKDVNHTEIYAGDKLSFSIFDYSGADTHYTGYVVWSGTRFMIWNSIDNEYYGSDGGFDLDWVLAQDDEVEVIGNVHDKEESK